MCTSLCFIQMLFAKCADTEQGQLLYEVLCRKLEFHAIDRAEANSHGHAA
jgi:hypothetical protein